MYLTVDVFEIKPENSAEVIVECTNSGELLLSLNETQTEPSQYRFETDVTIRYKSPGYSRLLMRFVNDNTAEEECGGLNFYTEDKGHIVSAGFPSDNYGHNLDCRWRVWAPVGYGIKFTFNLIDLANKDDCNDKLELYRGSQVTPKNKRFRNICKSRDRPLRITLNFNMIVLRFTTDVKNSDRGFMVSYEFYKIPSRDREHMANLQSERHRDLSQNFL